MRTRNLGEADRIVTLYTREQGKVECVARGSRRVRSRLTGPTQLFTHGRFLLFSGRSLETLSQAEIVSSFAALRDDLTKMAYASYLAELLDVSVEPGEPSEDLFDLCLGSFRALEAQVPPEVVSRHFELRLMALLGYAPHIAACVGCGRPPGEYGEQGAFSTREGGFLCPRCLHRDGAAIAVRRSTLEWIRRLAESPADRLHVLRIGGEDLRLLEAVARAWVDYRIERPLKSLGFLAALKDLA